MELSLNGDKPNTMDNINQAGGSTAISVRLIMAWRGFTARKLRR